MESPLRGVPTPLITDKLPLPSFKLQASSFTNKHHNMGKKIIIDTDPVGTLTQIT
jgi:hypothetical protein